MVLIADSGSTKTDWGVLNNGELIMEFQSIGMNPYNITYENIIEEIDSVVMPRFENKTISELYFYGSGCSTEQKKKYMKNIFENYFPSANIEIHHDLMGACRALCGNEKGIVGILGTGSNSCLYDGNDIAENVPSLGYVLCDEGAGSTIGKILLKSYLRNEFPNELHESFKHLYPGTENDFLDNIYKKTLPNRYLASFTPFAYDNRGHSYISNLLEDIFNDFFKCQIVKYSDYQKYNLNLIGSVGYLFQNIIQTVGERYSINLGKVLRTPMQGLIEFHSKRR